eukprot:scaffold16809_cov43-Cyclotella_meneghiniana.AAC.1
MSSVPLGLFCGLNKPMSNSLFHKEYLAITYTKFYGTYLFSRSRTAVNCQLDATRHKIIDPSITTSTERASHQH